MCMIRGKCACFRAKSVEVSGQLPAIFGAFVSILDTMIVNSALPHIQQAFGADLHVASYVTTAYTLAQGVTIAASGFLANRFGIKRVYLLSLALFTLGSAL
jgi:MFS family permease